MFGISPMEMMVILAIALIIFGPGKLPEIAQTVGKAVREFRSVTGELTGEFERAMSDMTSDITSVGDEVKQSMQDVQQSAQTAVEGVRLDQTFTPTPSPPSERPAWVQASAPAPAAPAAPRMPTKADPLADLMGGDASPAPTNSQPGSSGN